MVSDAGGKIKDHYPFSREIRIQDNTPPLPPNKFLFGGHMSGTPRRLLSGRQDADRTSAALDSPTRIRRSDPSASAESLAWPGSNTRHTRTSSQPTRVLRGVSSCQSAVGDSWRSSLTPAVYGCIGLGCRGTNHVERAYLPRGSRMEAKTDIGSSPAPGPLRILGTRTGLGFRSSRFRDGPEVSADLSPYRLGISYLLSTSPTIPSRTSAAS